VRAVKLREVTDGHDGTWVAHPGLVPVAMAEFAQMPNTNQLDRMREDVSVSAADLLTVPQPPTISEDGLRTNIRVGIQYLESWLRGSGCVPINNLMEDAATAEISRAQLWQWVRHKSTLADGRVITLDLVESLMADELLKLRDQMGPAQFAAGQFVRAASLFQRMTESARFPEFLTSIAYREL
jgi:malate synthase